MRRHVCFGEDCKEPVEKPEPPESDLRRHVCLTGPCSCPAGQTMGKDGCVANKTTTAADTVETSCGAGTVWNGSSCVVSSTCPAGQVWNGAACARPGQCSASEIWDGGRCVNPATECTSYDARAIPIVNDLRRLQSEVQQECTQDPGGQSCNNLKMEQQSSYDRYMALWNEAPAACRTRLSAPGSLI
ncbi:MAG TPA: hypothetical protein VKV39_11350 [Candidatus Sulfotelmatobacter sp.]|nr:hypothetical protein [Candidatus Sulfotelmatobacter sp.]